MRFSFFFRRIDRIDMAVAVGMALSAFFVLSFFWQASAGASRREEAFLDRLRLESEKRVQKERKQIASFLDLAAAGETEEALSLMAAAADGFEGNSQFHLFLARAYRERREFAPSLRQYRKALESNRDYSDRRSPFFQGDALRPFLAEAKAAYLDGGRPRADVPAASALIGDLFYIERSLAGGCH